MRRGHAERRAPLTMRPPLLLLLLAALSCRGDASTTAPSTTKSGSAGISTTVKSTTVSSGSAAPSTSKQTAKTLSTLSTTTTSSIITAKDVSAATTKEAQKTTVAAVTSASVGSTSKGITVKPPSSSVTVKTTQEAKATTAHRTTTVPSSSPLVGSKGVSPSVPSSSGSPATETKTPSSSPTTKDTPSAVAPTASSGSDALTKHPTTPGHTSSTGMVGSATTAKEKITAKEKTSAVPTESMATTTARTGPTSPKGALPVPGERPEGKIDSTTTQLPSGVAPLTPDSSRTTTGTTKGTALSPKDDAPSLSSGANRTSFQTKIICEDAIRSKYQGIVLTFNESRPCDSLENSALKEPLMKELCRAVKSSFNRSRDDCTVSLASIAGDPKQLAILGVSVTTHSVDDELSESLAVKKGELEKLGLKNLTYGEKPMDLDTEDRFGMPLIITIVCMAASLLLVAAIYGCCHQRISRRKDQQRLTEELQTMENGYHDNPTLEVMETSAEMQEKKVNLNGELADSWIVPMDSLTKEDLEEEEDTHL